MVAPAVDEAVDLAPGLAVLDDMAPVEHGHAVPLLQAIQDAYGYLPREVLVEVAARTRIPVSHLYGIATFYAQFYLEPHGRHTVRVCRGTACHVRGRQAIEDAVGEQLGVDDGETTEDRQFSVETVACLGTCFLAPVVMIDHDYFGSVTADTVPELLEPYR